MPSALQGSKQYKVSCKSNQTLRNPDRNEPRKSQPTKR